MLITDWKSEKTRDIHVCTPTTQNKIGLEDWMSGGKENLL